MVTSRRSRWVSCGVGLALATSGGLPGSEAAGRPQPTVSDAVVFEADPDADTDRVVLELNTVDLGGGLPADATSAELLALDAPCPCVDIGSLADPFSASTVIRGNIYRIDPGGPPRTLCKIGMQLNAPAGTQLCFYVFRCSSSCALANSTYTETWSGMVTATAGGMTLYTPPTFPPGGIVFQPDDKLVVAAAWGSTTVTYGRDLAAYPNAGPEFGSTEGSCGKTGSCGMTSPQVFTPFTGGVYAQEICFVSLGACCLDAICLENQTDTTCAGSGGSYAGHGSSCGNDCDGDGVTDVCAILGGAQDCQSNGVPDQCELNAGTSRDCNNSGMPDECDVSTGASPDGNADGVPDECQYDCEAHEQAKLMPSDGAAGDVFGLSVARLGDTIVVGAPHHTHSGLLEAGVAYVIVRTPAGWTEQAVLVAGDAAAFDHFGTSVAMAGDTIVVGAPHDDAVGAPSTGGAYVFVLSGGVWTQQAKLNGAGGAVGDRFGIAAAVDGDTVLVSAHSADPNGITDAGAAYVFVRADGVWAQQARLTASDAAVDDRFGRSVALSGDVALVGAYYHNHGGLPDVGAAYVFARSVDGWVQQAELTASDASADQQFGVAVALDGVTALVGAVGARTGAARTGAAYIFSQTADEWWQRARLTASDAAEMDWFGYPVTLSRGRAVVGAHLNDTSGGTDAGAAYVFSHRDGVWLEQAKLTASDGSPADSLGISVAFDGTGGVIGAYHEDAGGDNCGSVYVFDALGDCDSNGTLDSCDLVAGTSRDCNSNGIPDDCEIAEGTSPDCNTNGVPDACDLASGTSTDANSNGTPDECEAQPDCNSNGVPDAQDITGGTSADCNTNAAPDECDIVGGTSGDCNGDDVPDECDIAAGSSADSTGPGGGLPDGIPDECEYDCIVQESERVQASDAEPGDAFGYAVAMDGNLAVVGASYRGMGDFLEGRAYVLRRTGSSWVEEAVLTPDDPAGAGGFGYAVAISGETVLVGAPRAGPGLVGAIYVFENDPNGWVRRAKLRCSECSSFDAVGYSVALSGTTAIAGAIGHFEDGAKTGAAYVFVRPNDGWHDKFEDAKLTAADLGDGDEFGISVASEGSTAVVGASQYSNSNGPGPGKVYMFERVGSTWLERAKLTASDGAPDDWHDVSIAIDGNRVAVGGARDDAAGSDVGAVWIFERPPGGWVDMTETKKLTASDGSPGDYFGFSVSLCQESLLVSAYYDDPHGYASGSAYLYRFDGSTWVEQVKLIPDHGLAADNFGWSVALGPDTGLIGVPSTRPFLDRAGSLYVFEGLESDCNSNGVLDACEEDCDSNGVPDQCDIMAGTAADCNDNAIPDSCDVISATSADCNSNGIPDECDTAAGTSPDCDVNGTPDECQFGGTTDCNTNGTPDLCDIAAGTSLDVNINGVPDGCECGCTDFVLVIDSTGSMVGALDDVKADVDDVIDVAIARAGRDLRLGLMTFRNAVTVVHPLTSDFESVRQSILALEASGGLNEPEASDAALAEMLNTNATCLTPPQSFNTPFRPECYKLAALITDARPAGCDDEYVEGVDDVHAHWVALEAKALGIQLWPILIPKEYPPDFPLRGIMQDYANTTGGTYAEVEPDGTGTAAALLRMLRTCPGCGTKGDLFEDGVVQQDDYAIFRTCMTGPGGSVATVCQCADLDDDGDVDLMDYVEFLAVFPSP